MPPERYEFDLRAPHPNVDIDAMRRLVAQTLAGVDDAYWLTGLLSTLLDEALDERDQIRAELDGLTARVAALEPAEITEGAAP